MEHLFDQPSDVCDLMPRQLEWYELECNGWLFWSKKHHDELEYQQMSPAPVDLSSLEVKAKIQSVSYFLHPAPAPAPAPASAPAPLSSLKVKRKIQSVLSTDWCPPTCLFQFWVPIKVNGSTFLSIADQPFVMCNDKRLCSYRRLCLDHSIPIEGLPAPPARVYSRCLPEYNPDFPSYSTAEFPLRESAIRLGVHSYYAFPLFNLLDNRCVGVFEMVSVSTKAPLYLPNPKWNFESVKLYNPQSEVKNLRLQTVREVRLAVTKNRLNEILKIRSLPFAQIWIPYSRSGSLKVLYHAGASINDPSSSMYLEFERVSEACFIENGKALVGRAFASHGSCFCKDVTLLSINQYPLVPSARKARLTQSFAICLQNKCDNNIVFVVEYFLPSKELVATDIKTFLNTLLSTMKELLPGFIVATGKELGQRMLVEVVKLSPSDELDSFEIGQPLPSVQSLQDGGETTEIDSFCQQSNLKNRENNVAAALLLPSCSSHKRDSLKERTVKFDPPLGLTRKLQTEERFKLTNRGTVNVDVAHDNHIEDAPSEMLLDSHFKQPNLEINSVGNARSNDNVEHSDYRHVRQLFEAEAINRESNFVSGAKANNEKIHSHKNNAIQRIEKDHGITREVLEQHFGMTLADAAKNLHVSRATLKRIRKQYGISRWPHHKTRKVIVHVSQGVSFQDVEPCMVVQQCPALSQEKGTDCLGHKRSPATGVSRDSLMTLKVTYRGDIIKFQLSLSSTRVELEGEVEKRLKVSLQRFSIKYQDEDEDWILITTDSDLRDGMRSLRLSGRTTMRLLVTPEADT